MKISKMLIIGKGEDVFIVYSSYSCHVGVLPSSGCRSIDAPSFTNPRKNRGQAVQFDVSLLVVAEMIF